MGGWRMMCWGEDRSATALLVHSGVPGKESSQGGGEEGRIAYHKRRERDLQGKKSKVGAKSCHPLSNPKKLSFM